MQHGLYIEFQSVLNNSQLKQQLHNELKKHNDYQLYITSSNCS